jgi:hypothetical protein
MAKFKLGDREFPTKAAAIAEAKRILDATPAGTSLQGEDAIYIHNVFRLDPKYDAKAGDGILRITVQQNPGSRCFWIVRRDGMLDWSYRNCFYPPSHRSDVAHTFRDEIQPQVDEFRRRAFEDPHLACAVSREPLTRENAHADHEIPFATLLANFLDERGLDVEAIEIIGGRFANTFNKLKDRELAFAWRTYHFERAVLRMVTKEVNTSLLRKKIA